MLGVLKVRARIVTVVRSRQPLTSPCGHQCLSSVYTAAEALTTGVAALADQRDPSKASRVLLYLL